jgi:AcrR family transcriptional regulator
MSRTQLDRRADTRQRLLAAARDLVAERGVAGASVDALAEAADRTSGALYGQFGSKDGLLLALLDHWTGAAATAIAADFEATSSPDERLESLWRNFVSPPVDGGDAWVLLEHELWLYACRNHVARPHVAARYDGARRHLAAALAGADGSPRSEVATLLIALMIGLEMQRRLDPDAVSDQLALIGLRALLTAPRGI